MRVLQVGVGDFGRSWVEVLSGASGVELAGVVDPSPAARQWVTQELGIPPEQCFESLDDALTGTVADAVLVATPELTHCEVARTALEAGKHVLVEKPLTTTVQDAQLLIETAARTGRIVMASQNYRYRPPARTMQRLVREGALGTLQSVKISCRRDTRSLWPSLPYRYQMRHPYLTGMAIHHFDLLRAITGENARKIYARSWRAPDSPYLHHPAMAAILELECGATVIYEGDWAPHDTETSWDGAWELVGETGRLTRRIGGGGLEAVVLQLWGGAPHVVEQEQLAYTDRAATLEVLRMAVEEGEPPETVATDNIRSVAMVAGCLQSIETGSQVDVAALIASRACYRV